MKRKINRIFFHLAKGVLGVVLYINVRQYMKFYTLLLRFQGLKFNGNPRFIAKSVKFDDFDRITIGDRFVASMNVQLLTHDYSYTTALISIGRQPETDIAILKNISIGDNVFIGLNSIIMPGCTIGNNVIIGSGSVVRGKIPDFSIVAGNPAIVIGDIREHAKKMEEKNGRDFFIDSE